MADRQRAFERLREDIALAGDGRLRVRGQEMILMPRHFFRYIQRYVWEHAGEQTFAEIFARAGYDGAVQFCRVYQQLHGGSRREAVEAYLAEMSVRGWGHFSIRRLEPEAGAMEVELANSALAPQDGFPSGHVVWGEAARGALAFLRGEEGGARLRVRVEELPGGCRIHVEADRNGE